jgi:hypothetical protein
MIICGNSKSFIPLLISIACCCAFFVYFNFRINDVKFLVEKQNKVLTSFITNIQQDIKMNGDGGGSMQCPVSTSGVIGKNNIASPEAILSAKEHALRQTADDKIVVSDDEDDDSDEDSESDSGSDIDSDDDNNDDDNDDDTKNVSAQLQFISLNSIDMEQLMGQHSNSVMFEVLSNESLLNESSITELKDDLVDMSTIDIVETVETVETVENVETSENSDNLNYENMKVDELRKIVSDKNLSTKEELKKLKKPELLALLKK